jgi:hypothetical protein
MPRGLRHGNRKFCRRFKKSGGQEKSVEQSGMQTYKKSFLTL